MMNRDEVSAAAAERARAVGGRTAVGCVVVLSLILANLIKSVPHLVLTLLGMTVVLSLVAFRIGQVAGPRIAASPWQLAPLIGSLAALISLLSTALLAATVGLVWGLYDGVRGADWAYSYLGKPFLAVIYYGSLVAVLCGAAAGLLIRFLLRRS